MLAVLPADSVKALPESCQQLMLSPDSPIIDIYSRDIPIDPNGKILPWLWVVLLPFIDETRIVEALKLCENEMTDEEKRRNTFGTPLMFLHSGHTLGIVTLSHLDYTIESGEFVPSSYSFPPTAEIGHGICGLLSLRNDLVEEFGLHKLIRAPNRPLRAFQDITTNRVMSLEYKFPEESDHLSALLPGVDLGIKALCDYDGIVARPKLNKGRFNIADIAERMREEKANRAQLPHQRMVLAGLGRTSQTYPEYQRQGQYPYNRNEGNGYDYRDSYRAENRSHDANNFSRGNYDEYSRPPERGYPNRNGRDYPTRNERDYPTRTDPRQYPSQYPPHESYQRSYPPQDSYRGYVPPSQSFNPPPYYPPQQHPQHRDAPSNWNPPPRGRAPPIPSLSTLVSYPPRSDSNDPRNSGFGGPPQQSLGDLRNQFSHPASHQGYGYGSAPPAYPAPNTRDPRMRR